MSHEVNTAEVDRLLGKCERNDFLFVIQTVVDCDQTLHPHAGKIAQAAVQVKTENCIIRYESLAVQAREFCDFIVGKRGKPTWLA